MDIIKDPWPWYVAGPLLSLILFSMLYFGKTFGFSSNLRTMCAAAGAGKLSDFFNYNWKNDNWNLVFLLGTVAGAFIAVHFLMHNTAINLNPKTVAAINDLGINGNSQHYVPMELFGVENLGSIKTLLILIGGGFLIGFGTRYAGGCTSGHAITGLSQLQIPSLIAVIGFFAGGLIMTHFLMPLIF